METLLAEQPLLVSLMLAALAAGFTFGWLQSRKKAAAAAAVACALLIPVAWFVASRWETDREQIERLVYEIADAVERNDVETAVSIIGDPALQSRARVELNNYTFEMAAVNKIRSIDVIEGTFPTEADVDMSVKVDVSHNRGSFRNVRVLRRLLLRLEKSNDDWVVTDYRHMPITGQSDQYSRLPQERSIP